MLTTRIAALLVSAFVGAACGDYLTKRWTQSGSVVSLAAAWACYSFVTCLWFVTINERSEIGRVGVVWTICSILATVTMGVFVFGEVMSQTNKVGILLCIVGVIMTSI